MNLESEFPSAIRLARPVVARILRCFPADVDDVLQSAALRAWVYRRTFRGDCKFSTWYTRIAVRTALMWLRSAKSKKQGILMQAEPLEESASMLPDFVPGPEELAREAELRRILSEEISKLPPMQQLEGTRMLQGDFREYNSVNRKARRFNMRARLRLALAERGIAA